MRAVLLSSVVVCLVAVPARAQSVGELTNEALAAARAGDCERVDEITERMREEDPLAHANVVSAYEELRACLVRPARPTRKSPQLALGLPLGMTIGGTVLTAIGAQVASDGGGVGMLAPGLVLLAFGPSVGHIYVGELVARPLLVQLGGFAIAGAGWWRAEQDGDFDRSFGAALIVTGALVYTAGAIWQLRDAPAAASRHNARLQAAPVVTAGGVGLGVAGTW
jgi:hypothetical protein